MAYKPSEPVIKPAAENGSAVLPKLMELPKKAPGTINRRSTMTFMAFRYLIEFASYFRCHF